MATFLSPRVQVTEVDLSAFAPNQPVSVGAIVLRSSRGKLTPEFVSSARELREKFSLNRKQLDRNIVELFSAHTFLSSGVSGLWVARAVSLETKGACIIVNKQGSTNPITLISDGLSLTADKSNYVFPAWGELSNDALMLLYAKSPGKVGNNIAVTVKSINADEKTFVMEIVELLPDGDRIELFSGTLSTVPESKDGYGNSIYILDVFSKHDDVGVRINPSLIGSLPATTNNFFNFAGGVDADVGVGDLGDAIQQFENKEEFDIDLFIQGGIGGDTFRNKLVTVAETRGDCFALLDVDEELIKINDIRNWRKNTFTVSSSYAGIFCPWLRMYDFDNDREMFIPPSGVVGAMMAKTDKEFDPWWAPAGLNRGAVKVLGLKKYYTQAERDELDRLQVNTFMRKPGVIALWNNRTLQVKESAFSFIETRRLLNYIKRNVVGLIESFLFEPLVDATRERLLSALDEFLRSIRQRMGLYDHRIVSDPLGTGNNPGINVDRGLLTVEIFLKPVRAIRYIALKLIVTRTGVTFEEGIV